MRGTSTMESLIGKVHLRDRDCHDQIVPVQDMSFESLDAMTVNGVNVEVLPTAKRLIANRLRIPVPYLERCPADLQADNLNYWIEQEALERKTLFCRFDGPRLRAVFTERYTSLDNIDLLHAMLRHGFKPEQEVQYIVDDQMLLVKVPDYSQTYDIRHRDEVVPGISFGNSEVGLLALSIQAYFYRLVCSNGLIVKPMGTASRFKHTSRKVLDDFPSVLGRALEESRNSREQFMISTQTPVPDHEQTLAAFNAKFQLSKTEVEAVDRAWPMEEGGTMFNVINTYTRAAQDPALGSEESFRLERVGGQVLAMVGRAPAQLTQ